jgi:hypothetical protein
MLIPKKPPRGYLGGCGVICIMLVSVYVRHLAAVYTRGILSSLSLWYSSELCVRIGRRWLALVSCETLGQGSVS